MYRRAKDGLREILDDLESDGPVSLPAYVPAGLPATVEAAGFDVAYYPVDDDLTVPVDVVDEHIDELEPTAILFVHYFGFVDPAYRSLRRRASGAGAFVIEDAARGLFGRDEEDVLLGSTGDAAIFCPHKTLPAPNGGLLVRRTGRSRPANESCLEGIEPVKALLARVVGPRRSVSAPASASRPDAPTGVPASETCEPGWISRRGLNRSHPETVQTARLERYRGLHDRLVDEVAVVTPRAGDGSSPYGVGVRAPDRQRRNEAYVRLRSNGLPAEVLSWPPFHDELEEYRGAVALRRRLLVLPTHQQVPLPAIEPIAETVSAVMNE